MAQPGIGLREQAIAGNDAAFETLIAPLVEPALRLAYSMLGAAMLTLHENPGNTSSPVMTSAPANSVTKPAGEPRGR